MKYFCQATCIDITKDNVWTDTTVAMGWIHQDPIRWKTLVGTQVTEIVLYDPLTMETLSREENSK